MNIQANYYNYGEVTSTITIETSDVTKTKEQMISCINKEIIPEAERNIRIAEIAGVALIVLGVAFSLICPYFLITAAVAYSFVAAMTIVFWGSIGMASASALLCCAGANARRPFESKLTDINNLKNKLMESPENQNIAAYNEVSWNFLQSFAERENSIKNQLTIC